MTTLYAPLVRRILTFVFLVTALGTAQAADFGDLPPKISQGAVSPGRF
jgi:hypothetical protein